MANNFQNFNIRNFNSANLPVSGKNAYSMSNQSTNSQPVSSPQINNQEIDTGQNNNIYDAEYQVDNPSHTRLNALDSTILEAGAYQNIDDEVFKTEYKISKLESEIKNLDAEIESAKNINDFQKVDVLTMRKHSLQASLHSLNASYGDSDVTAKLSGELASIFTPKPTILSKILKSCKTFISDKVLPKVSKNFSSGKDIKSALSKLKTLNKGVDEIVTTQTPYGEADERYDKLTNYLNRANVIHFQISKTIGTPTFFDTISSIDKEKVNKTMKKSNFNNMTGKPNHS